MGWSNRLYGQRVPEKHKYEMDITELDLDGVRHNDIENTIEEFVLSKKPPMSIVIGRSEKMKEIVRRVLEKYKMSWEIPRNNYGLVKIKN
tara:strand:+ start:982 stop:1251 length:270 start_codon:yes stop_codon:yes gene_type:complete